MKILFFGDSITDMGRCRDVDGRIDSYGMGYVYFVGGELFFNEPSEYEIVNRGISGNRVVDLYDRIEKDVWDEAPDCLSILIGVNDVMSINRVEIDRFENVYRMMLNETKMKLPNTRIILCEPFLLEGSMTENTEENPNRYEEFCQVYQYASVVKKLAEEFNVSFVALQEKFNEKAQEGFAQCYLYDGVHPHVAGAKLIANEWLKVFKQN